MVEQFFLFWYFFLNHHLNDLMMMMTYRLHLFLLLCGLLVLQKESLMVHCRYQYHFHLLLLLPKQCRPFFDVVIFFFCYVSIIFFLNLDAINVDFLNSNFFIVVIVALAFVRRTETQIVLVTSIRLTEVGITWITDIIRTVIDVQFDFKFTNCFLWLELSTKRIKMCQRC